MSGIKTVDLHCLHACTCSKSDLLQEYALIYGWEVKAVTSLVSSHLGEIPLKCFEGWSKGNQKDMNFTVWIRHIFKGTEMSRSPREFEAAKHFLCTRQGR